MTATATRPKAGSEKELRAWIAERSGDDPPADLLGEHLPEYARRKAALLTARRKAAAEYEQGKAMLREAESIPELSREALAARPIPANATYGELARALVFLTDPAAPAPDAARRHELTTSGRALMAQAVAFLARTKDAGIEREIQTLQANLHAVRTRMKEREPLLNLEAAIAECQAKCERLSTGAVSATEAARFASTYDNNSGKHLLAAAKDELRGLISERPKVAKAREEQTADEREIAAIRAKMQRESDRTVDALAGMDWGD